MDIFEESILNPIQNVKEPFKLSCLPLYRRSLCVKQANPPSRPFMCPPSASSRPTKRHTHAAPSPLQCCLARGRERKRRHTRKDSLLRAGSFNLTFRVLRSTPYGENSFSTDRSLDSPDLAMVARALPLRARTVPFEFHRAWTMRVPGVSHCYWRHPGCGNGAQ